MSVEFENAIMEKLDGFQRTVMKKLDNIQTRLDTVEQKVDNVQTRLDTVEQKVDNVQTRLDSAEQKLDIMANVNTANILNNQTNNHKELLRKISKYEKMNNLEHSRLNYEICKIVANA